MTPFDRNNVTVRGQGGRTILFSHGFGCDQSMWRSVARRFEPDATVVLFDHVGAGRSLDTAYEPEKYAQLSGYAQDIIEIVETLDRGPVVFVGHSISATIGVLATLARPDLFQSLVLVCASPRYIDDDDYKGGFVEQDIDELLDLMEKNTADWSAIMSPLVAGASADEAKADWEASVCRLNPRVARTFARLTFRSDHRADYARLRTPTILIDSLDDALAPPAVGAWLEAAVPGSRRIVLPTQGHSPHMTAPGLTAAAIAGAWGDDIRPPGV